MKDKRKILELTVTKENEEIEDDRLNTIADEMNDRGVTPEQLKEAYKELGWL